jgi:hypothetical protein
MLGKQAGFFLPALIALAKSKAVGAVTMADFLLPGAWKGTGTTTQSLAQQGRLNPGRWGNHWRKNPARFSNTPAGPPTSATPTSAPASTSAPAASNYAPAAAAARQRIR